MGVFCAPEAHGKPRATLDEGLAARKPGYGYGRAMVGDGDADPPPPPPSIITATLDGIKKQPERRGQGRKLAVVWAFLANGWSKKGC